MGTAFISLSAAKLGLERRPSVVEETRLAMGGPFRITTAGGDLGMLKSAVKAAFEEVWRLERLMTIYQPESEISGLNRLGEAMLSLECSEVLQKSIYYSECTEGAFDVTMGDFKNIEVASKTVRFRKAGMTVDLGAIGIGYAVDQAINVLKTARVKSALVDGGGEVKALGTKSKGLSWRVGIRDPFQKNRFIKVIGLEDASISTSGNYITPHIVDPRTGSKPQGLASATIVTADATMADALSTAAFVLGPKAGLELIEKTPDVEGLLMTSTGEIIESSGLQIYRV
jgi:thiamine biosynthesis lipoprotein